MSVDSGARLDEVDRVAQDLTADAASLDAIAGQAATAMSALMNGWQGPDARSLDAHWRQVGAPALAETGESLRTMVSALRKQMGDQRATSGAGGPGLPTALPRFGPGEGAEPGDSEDSSTQEQLREANDAFVSIWALLQADIGINAMLRALGDADLLGVLPGLLTEQATLTSRIQALEVLKSLTGLDATSAAELESLSARLGVLESSLPGVARAESLASGLSAVSRVAGGLAVVGDVWTVLDPPHDGVRGGLEQGAAAVNGALTVAVLSSIEIPVVGEVVLVGTGLYLAGDWLYDNWEPFHNLCDDVGQGVENAWNATTEAVGDAVDAVGDAAGAVADGVEDAFDTVTGWF